MPIKSLGVVEFKYLPGVKHISFKIDRPEGEKPNPEKLWQDLVDAVERGKNNEKQTLEEGGRGR